MSCQFALMLIMFYFCRYHANIISTLAETLGEAVKEKVTRLVVGTYHVSRLSWHTDILRLQYDNNIQTL